MDYKIRIGNEVQNVIISQHPDPESYMGKAGQEGKAEKISVLRSGQAKFIVAIGDRICYCKVLNRTSSSIEFIINGELVLAQSITKGQGSSASQVVASVNELVTSNFPAKVIKVFPSEGTKLSKGDILIILEAMKMEAQIKAPEDCIVSEVFVREGDVIQKGTKLARLKFVGD